MKDKVKIDRAEVEAAGGSEAYARKIRAYIVRKQKLIRGFMYGFSAAFAACVLFALIGKGAGLDETFPALYWSVIGVFCALAVAFVTVACVNMYQFGKFIKKFQ